MRIEIATLTLAGIALTCPGEETQLLAVRSREDAEDYLLQRGFKPVGRTPVGPTFQRVLAD